jgi:dUTP pyrophosphatase
MIIEYARVRENAKPPIRANPSDAGLDIKYNPEDGKSPCRLQPGDSVILPTGLRFGVPHGYMLEVKNRSGVASKKSLIVGACVIDSGYDGEVFINLHNIGTTEQSVNAGDKIAQVVLVPVVHFRALESSSKNLYDWYPITMSNRGDGALGSTGE